MREDLTEISTSKPLPERMRPHTFDAVFGQNAIWAKNAPLRRLVEADRFHALIFWGPPGTGKTTVARLIGDHGKRHLAALSAVSAGVKDLRAVAEASLEAISRGEPAHLMFLDEIHRLNKAQQDILLPILESGQVKFIGATTENPSFEVNSAILSRSLVFAFSSLDEAALVELLKHALATATSDLPRRDVAADALEKIAASARGDARRALHLLEAVTSATAPEESPITAAHVSQLGVTLPLRYDKAADQHYDIISAMIKSIRGSHPDAALYYMARMLEAGEDPLFIARRIVIAASEDVGNASPTGLLLAMAAHDAVHKIGMPEARIMLAQAVTFLASAPKSNRSYLAIGHAIGAVEKYGDLEVPLSLRNAPTQFMKNSGYGRDYAYAHDDLEGARKMSYLPHQLKGVPHFYEPSESGAERQLREYLSKARPVGDD